MAPLPAQPPSSRCCWPVGVEVHLQRGALGGTEQGCSARHPGGCLGCISGLRGVSGGEECWRLGVLVSLHLSWPYLRSLCRTKRRRGARVTEARPSPLRRGLPVQESCTLAWPPVLPVPPEALSPTVPSSQGPQDEVPLGHLP